MNTLSSSLGITSDNFLVRLLLDHTLSLSVCHGWLTSLKKSRLPLSRGIG